MKWCSMQKITLTCFLFILCFTHSFGAITWKDFMKKAKHRTHQLSEKLKPFVSERYPFNNVSEQCTKSLIRYANGLKNWETWAVSMFDSTGKPSSSLLRGTNLDFGSFDDCLDTDVSKSIESDSFRGQFCMMQMQSPLFAPINYREDNGTSYFEKYGQPPAWMSDTMKFDGLLRNFGLYLGICTPSTCSEEDIINIVKAFTKSSETKVSLSDCQINEPKKSSLSAKLSILFILCLATLFAVGTYLDPVDEESSNNNLKEKENTSLGRKMLSAFSFYKNWEDMKTLNDKKRPLHYLPGIKCWLCIWVTFAHAIVYKTSWKERYYTNYLNILEILTPIAVVYENITSAAEYFFCISGFLLTYTLWKKLEKNNGEIKIKEVIIKKICRLMPVFAFLIMLMFVVPMTMTGPIWNSTWNEEFKKLYHCGWNNLFFTQNFLHFENACYAHTWHIAVYLQIQIVSIVLLVLVYRYPKTGIICGILINIGCYWHDFHTSLSNGYLLPSLKSMPDFRVLEGYLTDIYIKPYHHVASHTIGMILGWLVIKGYRVPKNYHIPLWILYFPSSIFLLYTIHYPTQSIVLAAVHNTFYNTIQSLLFTWLLYTCITGSSGFLRNSLSFSFYIPMDKLSYCICLLHPITIVYFDAVMQERIYMSKVEYTVQGFSVLLASVILATVGYLLVEGPFKTIFDLLVTKKSTVTTRHFEKLNQNGLKNETEKKEL